MHFVGELCRRLAKVNGKYKNRKYSARSSAQCSGRWWAKLRGAQQKFGQEIRPRDSAKIFDEQKFGQEKLDQTLPPRNAAKKFGQRNSTHNNQPNNSAKKIGQTFSLGLGVLVPGPTVPGPLVLGPWDPGPLGPGPEPATRISERWLAHHMPHGQPIGCDGSRPSWRAAMCVCVRTWLRFFCLAHESFKLGRCMNIEQGFG